MDIPSHYEHVVSFNTPWLQFTRESFAPLEGDADCDVAIVGGGISGVSTLYFLLTETDKKVALFEKDRVASGASGNNAGLACLHIERPIQDLVQEFGLEKTREGFSELDASWDLMTSILDTIGAKELLIPLPHATLGISSVDLLIDHSGREKYNREFGRPEWQYYIVDDPEIKNSLPADLEADFQFVPKKQIAKMLQIDDTGYIAVAAPKNGAKLGRLNSAKLCHHILQFLKKRYDSRLCLYEQTPIITIKQRTDSIALTHPKGTITAQDVILCTNGYKNFEIRDQAGAFVDTLHKNLIPREGYMAAYIDKAQSSYAQAFFDDRKLYPNAPYFYITHTQELTILGGPEYNQPDGFHSNEVIANRAQESKENYKKFLKNTYNITNYDFAHFWYGIMGYTSNDLRWVGQEQKLPHLWYNLGCNGIGIVTAFGAAKRLVSLLEGQNLPPSIFDPRH